MCVCSLGGTLCLAHVLTSGRREPVNSKHCSQGKGQETGPVERSQALLPQRDFEIIHKTIFKHDKETC